MVIKNEKELQTEKEIQILTKLKENHIIGIVDHYETPVNEKIKNLEIIMELAEGKQPYIYIYIYIIRR